MFDINDIVGKKFGKLTVIKYSHFEQKNDEKGRKYGKKHYYLCKCECGKDCFVGRRNIISGNTKSCGCFKHEFKQIGKNNDIVGKRFGKLVVLCLDHIKEKKSIKGYARNVRYYKCKCDCGRIAIIPRETLVQNRTKSCGCLNSENTKTFYKTRLKDFVKNYDDRNNIIKERIYKVWCHIKKRCYNKNCKQYRWYGLRNIKMCEEWKNDFVCFYNWAIKNGYDKTKSWKENSIDRINPNGDYCPENCRWVDMKTQNNNRRNNKKFLMRDGSIKTISDISKQYNMKYEAVAKNIRNGVFNMFDIDKPL